MKKCKQTSRQSLKNKFLNFVNDCGAFSDPLRPLLLTFIAFCAFQVKAQQIVPDITEVIVTGTWTQPTIPVFNFNLTQIGASLGPSQQSLQLAQIENAQRATSCPVAISNGEKHFTEVDYVGSGEFPLTLTRTFSSYMQNYGVFGWNWHSAFDVHLEFRTPAFGCGMPSVSKYIACPTYNQSHPSSIWLVKDGKRREFLRANPATPTWLPPDFPKVEKIYPASQGGWQLDLEGGLTYLFDHTGKPVSYEAGQGRHWKFQYTTNGILDKVVHLSGAILDFDLVKTPLVEIGGQQDAAYRVSGVMLPEGKKILYDDEVGTREELFLRRVTYPDALGVKRYGYDVYPNPVGLPGATLRWYYKTALENVWIDDQLWLEVDNALNTGTALPLTQSSGMVSGINRSTFLYDSFTSAGVENANGEETRHSFDGKRHVTQIKRFASESTPQAVWDFQYVNPASADQRLKNKSNPDGDAVSYGYDTNTGELIWNYESGVTTERSWQRGLPLNRNIWVGAKDPSLCLPGENCSPSSSNAEQETRHLYDSALRISEISERARQYDPGEYWTPDRKIKYDYDTWPSGLTKSVSVKHKDSAGNLVEYSRTLYDERGRIYEAYDADGNRTQYQYDSSVAGGTRPYRVVDPNAGVTEYKYDALGRTTEESINGKKTKYQYYTDNQIKRIDYPNGYYEEYKLDEARRVKAIVSPDPVYTTREIRYSYDLLNNVESVKHFVGSSSAPTLSYVEQERVYDKQGFLLRDVGQSGQNLTYKYTAGGRIDTITDSHGKQSAYLYYPDGKLESVTNPEGDVVTYTYGDLGRVSTAADGKHSTKQFGRNGFGEVEEIESPDAGGSVRQKYNTYGLISNQNGPNGSLQYYYDTSSRIINLVGAGPNGPEVISYNYNSHPGGEADVCTNGKGRLCGFSDRSGSTSYAYDADGNIVKHRSVAGGRRFEIQYAYDGFGRPSSMTFPNGNILHYAYDIRNRVRLILTLPPN